MTFNAFLAISGLVTALSVAVYVAFRGLYEEVNRCGLDNLAREIVPACTSPSTSVSPEETQKAGTMFPVVRAILSRYRVPFSDARTKAFSVAQVAFFVFQSHALTAYVVQIVSHEQRHIAYTIGTIFAVACLFSVVAFLFVDHFWRDLVRHVTCAHFERAEGYND